MDLRHVFAVFAGVFCISDYLSNSHVVPAPFEQAGYAISQVR